MPCERVISRSDTLLIALTAHQHHLETVRLPPQHFIPCQPPPTLRPPGLLPPTLPRDNPKNNGKTAKTVGKLVEKGKDGHGAEQGFNLIS